MKSSQSRTSKNIPWIHLSQLGNWFGNTKLNVWDPHLWPSMFKVGCQCEHERIHAPCIVTIHLHVGHCLSTWWRFHTESGKICYIQLQRRERPRERNPSFCAQGMDPKVCPAESDERGSQQQQVLQVPGSRQWLAPPMALQMGYARHARHAHRNFTSLRENIMIKQWTARILWGVVFGPAGKCVYGALHPTTTCGFVWNMVSPNKC